MLLEKEVFIEETLKKIRKYRIFKKQEIEEGEFQIFFDSDKQDRYIEQAGFCRYCSIDLHVTPNVKKRFMIGIDYPFGTDSTNFFSADASGAINVQDNVLRRRYGHPDISSKFDFKTQNLSGIYIASGLSYFDCRMRGLMHLPPIGPNVKYIKPIGIETAVDTILSSIFEKNKES